MNFGYVGRIELFEFVKVFFRFVVVIVLDL